MDIRVTVETYSGYRADERPLRFVLDGETFDIESIEARWHSPDAEFFRVRTERGDVVVLRHDKYGDLGDDGWVLERRVRSKSVEEHG